MGETIYSKAADLIRERGWWQGGVSGDAATGHCIHTALNAADPFEAIAATKHIRDYLGLGGDHLEPVYQWNDAPERTVEDVLQVLKECHVEAGGA